MGMLDRLTSVRTDLSEAQKVQRLQESRISFATEEIERNPWENIAVAMERSFYNIVDLAGTSVRKLSSIVFEEDDPRKETGFGWVGRNAGRIALWAGEKGQAPRLDPETDPELMDKFAELLGTTIPYTVAAIGGAAVGGGAGTLIGLGVKGVKFTAATSAALTSFSIMREEAYRGAIETGGTERQANAEANIVGGINALLELANLGTILRGSRTGGVILKSIALNARNKAWGQVLKEGGKFTMTMVRSATEEAIQEALQGTTAELVPRMLRGKEIEPGFWARRATEAAGGAIIGTLFSGLGSLGAAAISKGEARSPQIQEVEDLLFPSEREFVETEFIETDAVRDQLEKEIGREATPDEVSLEIDRRTLIKEQKMDAINEGQEIDTSTRVDTIETSLFEKFDKLVKDLDVGGIQKLTKAERSVELGKRVAVAQKIKKETFEKTGDIDKANEISKRVMAGILPSSTFEKFSDEQFSPSDWKALRMSIFKSDLLYFEQEHATMAVHKMEQGMIPASFEMKAVARVVGLEKQEALMKFAELGVKKLPLAIRILLGISSTSITLKTTMDVSLLGRQGLVTAFRFPKQWGKAFFVSHKAFWSSGKNAQAALNDMATRHYAPLGRKYGLAEHTIGGPTASQHELFRAQWLKSVPVLGAMVRASERAAAVGMNTLRNGIFDATVEKWEGQNRSDVDYKNLAEMANISTGVATGEFIEKYGHLLNAPFFSFGYNYSRFQLIGKGFTSLVDITKETGSKLTGGDFRASPASKLLAGELVLFVTAGLTALAVAEAMGAEVERDPRSSDFGKIKVGKMRVDVWAGFQQISAMVVQLAMGQGKGLRSGEIYTKDRLSTVLRYVQGKLSPIVGLGVELLSKKTFLGEPLPDRVSTPEGAIGYALGKIAPLVLEDVVDAIRFQGMGAGLAAFPLAFHGIGVSTFEPSPLDNLTEMRNHYSQKMFGNDWDSLGPDFQEGLQKFHPQLAEQERLSKFERRNAEFNGARQREAGRAVEKELSKEVQREMKGLGVTVGGLSRTLNKGWRLNGKLYQKYQDDLANTLSKVIPSIMTIKGYESLPFNIRVEMFEMVLKETKRAVRTNIITEANMKDLERVQ